MNGNFPENETLKQIHIDSFEKGVLEFTNNNEVLVTGNKVRFRKAQISDTDYISKIEQELSIISKTLVLVEN